MIFLYFLVWINYDTHDSHVITCSLFFLWLRWLWDGAEEKQKHYAALCTCKFDLGEDLDDAARRKALFEKIEKLQNFPEIRNLVLNQDTPLRVTHRRTLAIRKKEIISCKFRNFHVLESYWERLLKKLDKNTLNKMSCNYNFPTL